MASVRGSGCAINTFQHVGENLYKSLRAHNTRGHMHRTSTLVRLFAVVVGMATVLYLGIRLYTKSVIEPKITHHAAFHRNVQPRPVKVVQTTKSTESSTVGHRKDPLKLIPFLKEIGACYDSNYRNGPKKNQEHLNAILAPIIATEPGVPVNRSNVPSDATFTCPANEVFSGRLLETARKLYDMTRFSHEMDVLEARLYESMGLIDKIFISESAFANRGHRKRRFLSESLHFGNRFKPFKNVIEIVDLDHCTGYMNEIRRMQGRQRLGQWLWTIQDETHSCMNRYIENLKLDGLVVKTDVDEIPLRATWLALKKCEFRKGVQGPFDFIVEHGAAGKLCKVSPIKINRKIEVVSSTARSEKTPRSAIKGGVHITYMGGFVNELFKVSNHAEGGQIIRGGWLSKGNNPSICDMSALEFVRRECLLCYSRDVTSILRFWEPERIVNGACSGDNSPPVATDLPWVMTENPLRYPCFYGNARACFRTYEQILK